MKENRRRSQAKLCSEKMNKFNGISLSSSQVNDIFLESVQDLADKFFYREMIFQENIGRYFFEAELVHA